MNYKRLSRAIELSGVGLHTGKTSKVVLIPSNQVGINFIIEQQVISPTVTNVVSTTRSTAIGKNNVKVSTIEHLMATFYCLFLTGINVYVEGEEIPAFDGSARVFVEKILSAGLEDTDINLKQVQVPDIIRFQIDSACYEILPSDNFNIVCELYTDKSSLVNGQRIKLTLTPETYTKHIAYAKTFCYLDEVEKLLSAGLGKGGNTENVIVVDNDKVVNPTILTYENEFVRHKVLDFLGDLSLTNLYYLAEFRVINPSHYTNIEFCKQLLKLLAQ